MILLIFLALRCQFFLKLSAFAPTSGGQPLYRTSGPEPDRCTSSRAPGFDINAAGYMFLMVTVGSGGGNRSACRKTGTRWEEQRAKRTEGRLSARGFPTLAVSVWGFLQVLRLPALSSSSKTCPGLTSSQRPWPKASMAISHVVLGCCGTAAAQRSSDKSGSHASFTADCFWKRRILW